MGIYPKSIEFREPTAKIYEWSRSLYQWSRRSRLLANTTAAVPQLSVFKAINKLQPTPILIYGGYFHIYQAYIEQIFPDGFSL